MQEDLTMQETNKNLFNKAMILLVSMLLVIIFSIISINMNQSSVVYADGEIKLFTIHHVYLDDTYLGPIKDQSIVEEHLSDQIEEMDQANEHLTYGTDQELSYIPERVFSVDINKEQLLNRLDQQLVIDIQATTVEINDKLLGHFATEGEAEQAIFEYKSLYVDEAILT